MLGAQQITPPAIPMPESRHHPAGDITINPIGVVRSRITALDKMPPAGVPADICVHPKFRPALQDIQSNTHIVVLAWLDMADRGTLQTLGRRVTSDRQPRGVFGLRSSNRPNPIGLTSARLLAVEGDLVRLDRLDFVDGTPVIDIKRYSPGWDSIFSARTDREMRPPAQWPKGEPAEMLLVCIHFHGETCPGSALAVRAVCYATERWQIGRMHPDLTVTVGDDGCVADGLQALTGATFGSGRLHFASSSAFSLTYQGERITFLPQETSPAIEDTLRARLSDLFQVTINST